PPRTGQVSIIRSLPSTERVLGAPLNFQINSPPAARSAYRKPSSDPTNTRPISSAAGADRTGPPVKNRHASRPVFKSYPVTESSREEQTINLSPTTIGR